MVLYPRTTEPFDDGVGRSIGNLEAPTPVGASRYQTERKSTFSKRPSKGAAIGTPVQLHIQR